MIKWNVYGKISEIQRYGSTARPVTNIKYFYDAEGNRIGKRVVRYPDNVNMWTWYVRDAAGNVMATYYGSGANSNNPFPSNFTLLLKEQHIYGSSRIGVLNREVNMKAAFTNPTITNFERGNKNYEQVNHLGNVLATISDKKIQHVSGSTVDYYEADLVTANDFYPGGMMMPERKYSASGKYRYGFNGKENDNEVKGDGNQIDFGARAYDPRLMKWFATDKLQHAYPGFSPYNYVLNSPIQCKDPDGKLVIFINGFWGTGTGAKADGNKDYWSYSKVNGGWADDAKKQIGDYHARYYDGSYGGLWGGIFKRQMSTQARIDQGYETGKKDAAEILASLERDPNDPNKIIESVKFYNK